jgi:hypothetical protein
MPPTALAFNDFSETNGDMLENADDSEMKKLAVRVCVTKVPSNSD